jgi:alpha-L-rhamnosidase
MNKIIYIFLCCFAHLFASAQQLKVVDLHCNYLVNPKGVESKSPQLGWKLQSTGHQVLQTAYQILVSDNLESLNKNIGNVWDSKKIKSAQSIQLQYGGKILVASKTYFWKVKVWDNQNNISSSQIAQWQMGLLVPTDWKGAKWIAYEKLPDSAINILPTDGKKDKYNSNNIQPMLRKDFVIARKIKKATAFISGLGHFEMSLNGKQVGDHFLAPGWTKYDKEALYVTFDITQQLKLGKNAVGVMLGNGFYYIPPVKNRYRKLKVAFGYPKVICRLAIQYQDGSTSEIITDNTWKTAPSPITFSSIYGGEDYNANLIQKGWDNPGFNDKAWKNAITVTGPTLRSQKEEPVKIFENFLPKNITALPNGDWIYDLGQNASGIIELSVSGKKGDTIRIIPAELLKADGSTTQQSSGGPAYFNYILNGDGVETWRPKFTYYGFRYLQVKGGIPSGKPNTNQKPIITSLKGLHIRNAAAKVGSFESSNVLFNQTFNLIDWAIKSNMVSVFTDCPHREKLGWLEQIHLMGSSVRYNYDAAPLLRKSLRDMGNSQTVDGLIPEIAPELVKFEWGGDMFRDSPEWGSSIVLIPWYMYQWYGDKESIATYYPTMQRYLNYLSRKADGHILSQGLGDWYDLGPKPPGVSQLTPMGITATAIYYHDLQILEKIADLLGKKVDSKTYRDLAAKVKMAFNKKFFNSTTNQYGTGSQAANAMAVYMELVDPANKAAVVANIVKDIRERNNGLTAGDIGYRYLLRVLENEGLSNVIFDMNSRSDVPGYGMQLAKGATALTESWSALPANSNNHFMLGHLMEWFYSGLGGIRQEEGSIAFSKIRIFPEFVGDLTTSKVSYLSPYGLISTNWIKTATELQLEVNIPANTTANIYLPVLQGQQIFMNDRPWTMDHGPSTVENGRQKIAIGSGNYKFKVK